MSIKKNVAFRVDSSHEIGNGHLVRCIAIAQKLKKLTYNINFICSDFDGNQNKLIIKNNFKLILIKNKKNKRISETKDSNQTIKKLSIFKSIQILFVDHYYLSSNWEKKIKKFCNKLVVIDDLNYRKHYCDYYINFNYYKKNNILKKNINKNSNLLLGHNYAIIRNELINLKKKCNKNKYLKKNIKNILIFTGSSDPSLISMKILKKILELELRLNITLINNSSDNTFIKLKKNYLKNKNIKFIKFSNKIQNLIVSSDLIICTTSSIFLECCFFLKPTISIQTQKNQDNIKEFIIKKNISLVIDYLRKKNLDNFKSSFKKLYYNYSFRKTIVKNMNKIIDGKGVNRIVNKLIDVN